MMMMMVVMMMMIIIKHISCYVVVCLFFSQELTPMKSGLYIQVAQFEHAGLYECSAVSALQSDRKSAWLTVIGK